MKEGAQFPAVMGKETSLSEEVVGVSSRRNRIVEVTQEPGFSLRFSLSSFDYPLNTHRSCSFSPSTSFSCSVTSSTFSFRQRSDSVTACVSPKSSGGGMEESVTGSCGNEGMTRTRTEREMEGKLRIGGRAAEIT